MNIEHTYTKNGFCKHCGWAKSFIENTGRSCTGPSKEQPRREAEQDIGPTAIDANAAQAVIDRTGGKKHVLMIIVQLLFIIGIVLLVVWPRKSILAYTMRGIATIKTGAHPCAVCCSPTTTVIYGSYSSDRHIVLDNYCPLHAPREIKSSTWNADWGTDVFVGWLLGAAAPLILPIASLAECKKRVDVDLTILGVEAFLIGLWALFYISCFWRMPLAI